MSNQPEPWIKDGARATVISTGREVTLVGEPWQDDPTKEWCIDIDKKGFCVDCDDIKPASPSAESRLAEIAGLVRDLKRTQRVAVIRNDDDKIEFYEREYPKLTNLLERIEELTKEKESE